MRSHRNLWTIIGILGVLAALLSNLPGLPLFEVPTASASAACADGPYTDIQPAGSWAINTKEIMLYLDAGEQISYVVQSTLPFNPVYIIIDGELSASQYNLLAGTYTATTSGSHTFQGLASGADGTSVLSIVLSCTTVQVPAPIDPGVAAELARGIVRNNPGQHTAFIYTPVGAQPGQSWLDVWTVDANGVGHHAFFLSAEQLAQLPAHPAQNMVIANDPDGWATLYRLTTGEFQINIGPDALGNVETIIFDGVPPTTIRSFFWTLSPTGSPGRPSMVLGAAAPPGDGSTRTDLTGTQQNCIPGLTCPQ